MAKEIQLTKSLHFFIYVIVMVLLIGLAVLLYNLQGVNDTSGKAINIESTQKNIAGKAIATFECLSNQDCADGKKCKGGFCEGTNSMDDVSGQATGPFSDLSCVTNDDCFPDEQCMDSMCIFVGEVCVPDCASNQECVDGMCFDIIDDFEDYGDNNDYVSAEGDVLGQNNVNDYVASNQNTIPNNNQVIQQQPQQQAQQPQQQLQQNIQETPKQAIGGSCSITSDCANSVCDPSSGKCVVCYEDENCAITDYCDLMAKQCKYGCRSNYDCLSNERCVNGGCVIDSNTKQIPKQGAFIGEATTPKAKTILTAENNLKGDSSSQKVTVATGSIQNKNDDKSSLGGFAWAAIIFVTIGMFTAMVVVMHNHEKKHAQSINSPNTAQQSQGYQQQSQINQETNQLPQNQQYQTQQSQYQQPQSQDYQQINNPQVQSEPDINAPDLVQQPSKKQVKTNFFKKLYNPTQVNQQLPNKQVIDSDTDKQFLKYAKTLLDQGMNKDEAIQQLVNSGWDKGVLEQLFNQHASLLITSGERQQIENYIRYYVKKGLQKESIKQGLTNAGWSMEVINDIMQEF